MSPYVSGPLPLQADERWPETRIDEPERLRGGFLLFVLVLAAWWPIAPYWQSDDFAAVHWASSFDNVLGDLVGPQYGVSGRLQFYRPLITASFWIDHWVAWFVGLFGVSDARGLLAVVSHAHNAVAHSVSALLLGVVVCRIFRSSSAGWLSAIVWSSMPAHVAAVGWAVGRVDTHSVLFVMLALWFAEGFGRRGGGGALLGVALSTLLALGCKELGAAAVPLVALVALAARCVRESEDSESGPFDEWISPTSWRAFRASWLPAIAPAACAAAVFAAFWSLRTVVLGQLLGTYGTGLPDAGAAWSGLARGTFHLASPLQAAPETLASGLEAAGAAPDLAQQWILWAVLGFAPLAVTLVTTVAVQRRIVLVVGCSAAFLLAAAPTFPVWPSIAAVDLGGLRDLRYLYLPAMAFAVLVAAGGGRLAAIVWLLVAIPATYEARREMHETYVENRLAHDALLRLHVDMTGPEAGDQALGAGRRIFVSGLPRRGAGRLGVGLWIGIDRTLLRPFVRSTPLSCFALRPLSPDPSAYRIDAGETRGIAVPDVPCFTLADPTIVAALPNPSSQRVRVELRASAADDPTDFGLPALRRIAEGGDRRWLEIHGAGNASHARLTLFTASGYLTGIAPLQRAATPPGGAARGTEEPATLDMVAFFNGAGYQPDPETGGAYILIALSNPASIDLVPHFPMLVEVGHLDDVRGAGAASTTVFGTERTATELLELRFDRGLGEFLR